MKAAIRQEISDRLALLAVDQVTAFENKLQHPEDYLELQHDLEDIFYRELNQWQ